MSKSAKSKIYVFAYKKNYGNISFKVTIYPFFFSLNEWSSSEL